MSIVASENFDGFAYVDLRPADGCPLRMLVEMRGYGWKLITSYPINGTWATRFIFELPAAEKAGATLAGGGE
jgi:hypothetical protein